MGGEPSLPLPDGRRGPLLLPRDVPVSVRRPSRRPREELHHRGRARALPHDEGQERALADGMGRLRPSGGERRHRARRAPGRVDGREHRQDEGAVPEVGDRVRLGAGDRLARPAVLPLDAVDLHEAVRARARVPEGRARELVPLVRDGAGERAGPERQVRTVRDGRGDTGPRTVVLPDHRVRRPAARRAGPSGRLAGARARRCSGTGSAGARASR